MQAADIARVSNLYEPLLFWDNSYTIQPALAESVTPSSDAKTWTIKLRQGVTFHNGKSLTPEDVIFTLQRVAGKTPTSAGGALSAIIDFTGTKKVDASTVVIKLKSPYAVLDFLLAEYTFGIVPVGYDPKNPVGTGAFKYKSFTPGKNSVFTKYADYWGDKAKVDELQIQDFSDSNAQVNALLAGQIQTDGQPALQPDQLREGPGRLHPRRPERRVGAVHDAGRPEAVLRRAGAPGAAPDLRPQADDRVGAQRLRHARQRPLRALRPGVRQGPAAARAGHRPGEVAARGRGPVRPPVQLFTGDDIGSVAPASAALFVQQAKKAGVTVNVIKKNPFYGNDYLSYPFAQDFWNTRNYIPQAAVCALKGGTYNETHFDNSKFAGLIASAQAETDEAKRTTLLQDAQKIEYDEGGYIIWGFRRQVDAVSSKVSGIKTSKYLPLGNYKFQYASVSA